MLPLTPPNLALAAALLIFTAAPAVGAQSLQSLVDHAQAGEIVRVPAGIYRETVTIRSPVQLLAEPGAEIRGSDVWTDWHARDARWVSAAVVPTFVVQGSGNSPRSNWPEQAFRDGHPLEQVAANPHAGQFAVDAKRHVVLGDNPAGHTLEVTTRTRWIVAEADDVVIEGFHMAHASNPPQDRAALATDHHAGWTIRRNVLSDAHGAIVSLVGDRHQLLDNEITRAGDLGIHAAQARNCLIRGNRITRNNTEAYDAEWEAGGMKVSTISGFTIENNEVAYNAGQGIWCDLGCRGCTIRNNRVHHNARAGIFWEISTGVEITGNRVWENGWEFSIWGWGSGILVSSAANADVHDNTLAWNADGIVVLSQHRPDALTVRGNFVHDNVVIGSDADRSDPGHDNIYALGFLQDWAGSVGAPAGNNRAVNNQIFLPGMPRNGRFAYPGSSPGSVLEGFNGVPGNRGNRYISAAAAVRLLRQAALPTRPEPRR